MISRVLDSLKNKTSHWPGKWPDRRHETHLSDNSIVPTGESDERYQRPAGTVLGYCPGNPGGGGDIGLIAVESTFGH